MVVAASTGPPAPFFNRPTEWRTGFGGRLFCLSAHGKTCSFPIRMAALGADAAPVGDHPGVLLLACEPGSAAVAASGRRVRAVQRVGGLSKLYPALERPNLFGVVQNHGLVLGDGGRSGHWHLAGAGDFCRPRGARCHGLQDAFDHAVCGGAGDCGCAVGVHLLAVHRSRHLRPARPGDRLELPDGRGPGDAAHHHCLGVEANFLQLFVLSSGVAVHSQVADRSGRH